MTDTPAPQPRLASDLTLTTLENVDFELYELYRAAARQGQAIISGRTFINCGLSGPAVMLAAGGLAFDNTDFGYTGGDIRNIVLHPGSPNTVVGTIPFRDCKFIDCKFFAVGFTGPEVFLNQVLSLGSR